MRFLITIVTSVILGVLGGTISFQAYTFFSAEETRFQVSGSEPLLLVSNQEKLSKEGHDLTQETAVVDEITAESLPAVKEAPSPTPEPVVQDLIIYAPVASPSATASPDPSLNADNPSPDVTPVATPIPGGLSADLLFSLVNQHRNSLGLPSFQTDANLCSIAQSRAPELAAEFAGGRMHAGFYARHLPYWATENVIYQNSEQRALNWWLHSPIHRAAIQGNYTYSCVACSAYNCSEIFTNFTPKQVQTSSI